MMNFYNLTDEFPVLTFIDFEKNDERDFYTTYAITPYDHWLTDEEMVDTIDRIVSELNKEVYGEKAQTFLNFYAELFDRYEIYEIILEDYVELYTNNNYIYTKYKANVRGDFDELCPNYDYKIVKHTDKAIFIERCKQSLRINPLMCIIIPELHLLVVDLFDLTSLLHFSKLHSTEDLIKTKEIFERHELYNLEWGPIGHTIENTLATLNK